MAKTLEDLISVRFVNEANHKTILFTDTGEAEITIDVCDAVTEEDEEDCTCLGSVVLDMATGKFTVKG